MSKKPNPLVLRHPLRRSTRLVPLRARSKPPFHHQPIQLLAQRYLASLPPTRPVVYRRPWPIVFRMLLWGSIIWLGIITVLGGLILVGQTELVARIILGAVLTVVFGTPLLCVVGLVTLRVWAMTRRGRLHQRPSPTKTAVRSRWLRP